MWRVSQLSRLFKIAFIIIFWIFVKNCHIDNFKKGVKNYDYFMVRLWLYFMIINMLHEKLLSAWDCLYHWNKISSVPIKANHLFSVDLIHYVCVWLCILPYWVLAWNQKHTHGSNQNTHRYRAYRNWFDSYFMMSNRDIHNQSEWVHLRFITLLMLCTNFDTHDLTRLKNCCWLYQTTE